MTNLILIIVTAALVNNVVLSQFLGICSFVGVSNQIKTSASLGGAVIFVLTIASAVAYLLYTFILAPLGLDYLQTIVSFWSSQPRSSWSKCSSRRLPPASTRPWASSSR